MMKYTYPLANLPRNNTFLSKVNEAAEELHKKIAS
jgi:hypothetical protein